MSRRSLLRKLRYGRPSILWFQAFIYDVISNVPLRVVAEHSFFHDQEDCVCGHTSPQVLPFKCHFNSEKSLQNSIHKLRQNFLKGFDWTDPIRKVRRGIPRPWDAIRKWALLTTTVRISSSHFTGFHLIPRGSSSSPSEKFIVWIVSV